MFPEVYRHFLGLDAVWVEARLRGYQRLCVDASDLCSVPAIVENPASWVDGKLFRDVDDHCFELLDRFEDIEDGDYVREVVTLELPDGSAAAAQTYTIGPSLRKSVGAEWSAEYFSKSCLPQFVAKVLPRYLNSV